MTRKKNSAKSNMKEIICPFCHNLIKLENVGEFGIFCPICRNQKIEHVKNQQEEINKKLLDPSDPLGYFTHFPPEDDFL